MKVNYLLLVLMLNVLHYTSVYAQTELERVQILAAYDLSILDQLHNDTKAWEEKNREEALALARIHGWPVSYVTENGGNSLLVGVIDGKYPMYIVTTNMGAGITIRANRLHQGGSAGLNLNGENMLIGVWDEGLVRESHELFEGRATQMDNATDISNHATHVTGTIIGSGNFQNGNAKGMAPLAETINHNFANAGSETINAILVYGLLLSNNSWGIPATNVPVWMMGKYDSNAKLFDQIQYFAPYFLPVFSAGNSRNTSHSNQGDGGYDILTAWATAKNNMVVAATFEVLNYGGPGSVQMTGFSSWGPTDDGRIKPDISAKGVQLFSSRSMHDSHYGNSSGTSMSAPSVTGTLALLQQHYNNLNSEYMLASTLRGLVLHTADEAGDAPGPDYRFGWGLMNAERAAEVISQNGITSKVLELTLTENETLQFSGSAIPGERLVASISWTDKEGNVLPGTVEDDDTPMLINDLDLRIVDENNNTFYPWILDHFNFAAPATTGDNYRDNIEKIEIENPTGDYHFTITHKGSLFSGEQVVSLIISGVENLVLSNPEYNLIPISIYPNPVINELIIQSTYQISEVEVITVLGQSLSKTKVNSNAVKLDVSYLNSGIHILKIIINDKLKTYRFVKK